MFWERSITSTKYVAILPWGGKQFAKDWKACIVGEDIVDGNSGQKVTVRKVIFFLYFRIQIGGIAPVSN